MRPAATLLKMADALKGKEALLINYSAPDDSLREENCRPQVLHTAPTRSMLTDALAQYLVWKKWPHWFLVLGPTEKDKLYAEALRRSAKRFGAKIVEERTFNYDFGSRRTDGGFEQVQQQIPTFTQNAPDHEVLVVADEGDLFGDYLPYRTWDAAPGRRHRRPRRRELAPGHRAVGRHAVPEPFQALGRPHDAAARLQRLARGAHGRRGRIAHQVGRIQGARRLHRRARISTSPASRASGCRCAIGTARSASRSLVDDAEAARSACRRSRASCINRSELDTLGVDKPETKCQAFTQ